MAKRFGFFNSINGDRKYLASDIATAFDIGITSGLKADREDNFQIVPHEQMTVKMMPGGAMIYGHYLLDDEEELITLDMSDGELNRIDRVVIRYDKYERSVKTAVIKGTRALNPTPPAPLRTAEQFDLVLADIRINAATTEITTSNITDMRDSDLCGFIGVKGSVSQAEFDRHLAENVSQITKIERTVGIEGAQFVSTNRKVKTIQAIAFVGSTQYFSLGMCDASGQLSMGRIGRPNSSNGFYSHSNFEKSAIVMIENASNYFKGTIKNITDEGFEIAWEMVGPEFIDGVILITFLMHYHGGDK